MLGKKVASMLKVAFEKWEKQEDNLGSTHRNPVTFELCITDTDTAVNIQLDFHILKQPAH